MTLGLVVQEGKKRVTTSTSTSTSTFTAGSGLALSRHPVPADVVDPGRVKAAARFLRVPGRGSLWISFVHRCYRSGAVLVNTLDRVQADYYECNTCTKCVQSHHARLVIVHETAGANAIPSVVTNGHTSMC
jgi:hypothetical protein